MARFNASDVDNYGGSGGAGYFSLKNDHDVARVRFLYDSADDVEGYAVHKVEIDDRTRYVNCLREYNEPIEKCPFCREREPQLAKLYIPLYNIDEDKVQVWERGKKFFSKISGICARYGKNPIVSQIFEIERNGKAGDQQTTYEIYRTEDPADDTQLDDFEFPEIIGSIILDKTAEELDYYLNKGRFSSTESENTDYPRRRNESLNSRDEQYSRRTPASRSANRGGRREREQF